MSRPGDYAGYAEQIIFEESNLGALIMAYAYTFDNEQTKPL